MAKAKNIIRVNSDNNFYAHEPRPHLKNVNDCKRIVCDGTNDELPQKSFKKKTLKNQSESSGSVAVMDRKDVMVPYKEE